MTTTGKKVLLVDDDDDFLMQHKLLLEAEGYAVAPAGGRRQAEALFAAERPDIAVIDVMMEEADGGFILAHHIKQHNPNCPVIMVTSVSYETGIEFTVAPKEVNSWIKADAILAKPVSAEQLIGEIKRLTM
jgi:CheY-like chemotaxis protein